MQNRRDSEVFCVVISSPAIDCAPERGGEFCSLSIAKTSGLQEVSTSSIPLLARSAVVQGSASGWRLEVKAHDTSLLRMALRVHVESQHSQVFDATVPVAVLVRHSSQMQLPLVVQYDKVDHATHVVRAARVRVLH